MTLKTCFVAAVLAVAPSLGLACQWHTDTTASQCGQGQVYDANSGTCVDATTS